MSKIRKCHCCINYTLKEICSQCGQSTISSIPAKYPDSYDDLKRQERKKGYIERNIY